MVAELEELEHIGAGLAAPGLTLRFEDDKAGESKSEDWFQLRGLAPSKQSVDLSSHIAPLCTALVQITTQQRSSGSIAPF